MRTARCGVLTVVVLLLLPTRLFAWGGVVDISQSNGGHSWAYPEVDADGSGVLHAVYSDGVGVARVYYLKSTDGGNTWSAPYDISGSLTQSYFPSIAVDADNHLNVVWHDLGQTRVYYARSANGGASFSAPINLSTGGSPDSREPQIAAHKNGSGYIHVIWRENVGGNSHAYHRRSNDGGQTWDFVDLEMYPNHLDIAAEGGTYVHVVAVSGSQVLYKRSTNDGLGWSTAVTLAGSAWYDDAPSLAITPAGDVHCAWTTGTRDCVRVSSSSNRGETWGSGVAAICAGFRTFQPALAAEAQGHLHLVAYSTQQGAILHALSENHGSTWGAGGVAVGGLARNSQSSRIVDCVQSATDAAAWLCQSDPSEVRIA